MASWWYAHDSMDEEEEEEEEGSTDEEESMDCSDEEEDESMRSLDGEGSLVRPRQPKETRNWLELPADVLSVIFEKIGAINILLHAQRVCRAWRKLSLEPRIWRRVELTPNVFYPEVGILYAMARVALKRSQGQTEVLAMDYFGDDNFLQYVADRTSSLRCLRLISCYDISPEGLAKVASKLPRLEEIEITFFAFGDEDLNLIGEAYPHLKCFRLNQMGDRNDHMHEYDRNVEANAVANNMHELRQLQLVGNRLTDDGLLTILKNCPHLESFDIRACFNVKVDQSLQAKCARIKDLRLSLLTFERVLMSE